MGLTLASPAFGQSVPTSTVREALDPKRLEDSLTRASETVPSATTVQERPAGTGFVRWENSAEQATMLPVDRLPSERKRAPDDEVGVQDVFRFASTDRELLAERETRGRLRSVVSALNNEVSDARQPATSVRVDKEQRPKKPAGRADGLVDHLLMTMEVQRLQPIARVAHGQTSTPIAAQDPVAAKAPPYSSTDDVGVRDGDHWPLPNVKLRWSAFGRIGDAPVALQTYGFVDAGQLWRRARLLPGKRRTATVASVGLRLRLNMTGHISGGVEASRTVKAPSGGQ